VTKKRQHPMAEVKSGSESLASNGQRTFAPLRALACPSSLGTFIGEICTGATLCFGMSGYAAEVSHFNAVFLSQW
jgi:hypothetical protein